jgi:hypothetical protein
MTERLKTVDTNAVPEHLDADQRAEQRHRFLKQAGYNPDQIKPLADDAGFRNYFMLSQDRLLMDVPPGVNQVGPFIKIGNHLKSCGIRVPDMFEYDIADGFLVVENLGNKKLGDLMRNGRNVSRYLRQSVESLAKLHNHPKSPDIDLANHFTDVLFDEAAWLAKWYPKQADTPPIAKHNIAEYQRRWRTIFNDLPQPPMTTVMRDYMVDNLMVTPNDQVAAIDFQDGILGGAAYDLASLLHMARFDLTEELRDDLLKYYLDRRNDVDQDLFMRWYWVYLARRHSKIIGVFARLNIRDGKPGYLQWIPRSKKQFALALNCSADLDPVQDWLNQCMPDLLNSQN